MLVVRIPSRESKGPDDGVEKKVLKVVWHKSNENGFKKPDNERERKKVVKNGD